MSFKLSENKLDLFLDTFIKKMIKILTEKLKFFNDLFLASIDRK